MSKCIAIIGTRSRDGQADYQATRQAFLKIYEPGDTIVSGGCPKGGDRFAEEIAENLNVPITIHRPESVLRGSPKWVYAKAFYDRNTLVAQDADIVIACVENEKKPYGGGTGDTIKKFIKKWHGHCHNSLILV